MTIDEDDPSIDQPSRKPVTCTVIPNDSCVAHNLHQSVIIDYFVKKPIERRDNPSDEMARGWYSSDAWRSETSLHGLSAKEIL